MAKKAARQAPPSVARAAPARGAAPPARPGAVPRRPAPPPRPPETRVSLESLPEVEKRIDRMSAVERRQRLIERYESRYGEKLDLPKVFVPIEEEAKTGTAAEGAAAPKAVDEARLSVVTGMAPLRPAAPAGKPPAPAKPGLFRQKPVPPAAARPGAPAPPRPAAPAPPRPPPPVEAAPAAPAPKLPEGMTMGKYLFPQIWPFWGFPLYKYAKFRWPDKRGKQMAFAAADVPILILLAIPRLFGLFWAGLAITLYKRQKQKKAARAEAAAQEAPAAN